MYLPQVGKVSTSFIPDMLPALPYIASVVTFHARIFTFQRACVRLLKSSHTQASCVLALLQFAVVDTLLFGYPG
jgi:hypothetical protein